MIILTAHYLFSCTAKWGGRVLWVPSSLSDPLPHPPLLPGPWVWPHTRWLWCDPCSHPLHGPPADGGAAPHPLGWSVSVPSAAQWSYKLHLSLSVKASPPPPPLLVSDVSYQHQHHILFMSPLTLRPSLLLLPALEHHKHHQLFICYFASSHSHHCCLHLTH